MELDFKCDDGVVLAADKQLTASGYYKFSTNKIYSAQMENCRFMMTFSGSPETADVMFRRARAVLTGVTVPVGKFHNEVAIETLEKIFYDSTADEDGFETLIALWFPQGWPRLYKTSKMKVVEGYSEYIGSGDSSAIRHLSDFLGQEKDTVEEATVLASYYVSIANRYIDGCSGGPSIAVLRKDGSISHGDSGVFPDQESRFRHCEMEIGKELRAMLLRGGAAKES